MTPDDIDPILRETLEDHRLSRRERKSLREVIVARDLDDDGLAYWRHRAFALAKQEAGRQDTPDVMDWLEETIKALTFRPKTSVSLAQACFSPGEPCLRALLSHIGQARSRLDACVFTITDDRVTEAILAARDRGVAVRVISDDDKSEDRGSDIERLAKKGIAVRTDHSDHHMHHKFALFDGRVLATGSYNWTRSAARDNRENIAFTDDGRLVRAYQAEFDTLWERFE